MVFKKTIHWEKEIKRISNQVETGITLDKIGEFYGVSRQRIDQVLKKFNIDAKGLRDVRRAKKAILQEEEHRKKWGDKEDVRYSVLRNKFRQKKANAVRLGIAFDLDFGDIVFPERCPILDIELDILAGPYSDKAMSFDRLDPKKGYTKDNTVIISMRANRIKNDSSLDELEKIVSYLKTKI